MGLSLWLYNFGCLLLFLFLFMAVKKKISRHFCELFLDIFIFTNFDFQNFIYFSSN